MHAVAAILPQKGAIVVLVVVAPSYLMLQALMSQMKFEPWRALRK